MRDDNPGDRRKARDHLDLETRRGRDRIYFSSWPGLTRPSTSLVAAQRKQDVDGRIKSGHDGGRRCAGLSNEMAWTGPAMTVERFA